MMRELELEELRRAIAGPENRPRPGRRLTIAPNPTPFVAPPLWIDGSNAGDPFSVEVVFVQASAAVGKSMIAAYLSAFQAVPLLDLAKIPVSTHSLVGLIQSDLLGPPDSIRAFHSGALPLIVDALDEGRLLSGEQGFEGFLETTVELLLSDRIVTGRPKLIFFGRHESTGLAKLAFEISGEAIRTTSVEVGFFGEVAAWKLIDACARASVQPDAAYLRHPEPVRHLIGTYFNAIEAALGLEAGTLWTSEGGQAFAGYAPVLAALGSLLAALDNFPAVANRLQAGGGQEAWGVIETVLQEILDREQEKLCSKLTQQIDVALPPNTYDAHEQLTFLTQFVHRRPLEGANRVRLPAADQAKYFAMVGQSIREHPFIRDGKLGNAVLGSLVLAHAITFDLLRNTELQTLENDSRQPFVWRSLRRQLVDLRALIDGRYLGCVLNSFWSDPITQDSRVYMRSTDDEGAAKIIVPGDRQGELTFELILPITLYGQMKDCDIDVLGTVTLKGHAPRQSASTFYVHGTTTIICEAVEIIADSVLLDGEVWFEADQVTASPRLNLRPKNGTKVGFAGQFAEQYPWNQLSSTLRPPYTLLSDDVLTDLLAECRARLPGGGGVLTLNAGFDIPDDDRRMRWVLRRFPVAFPRLIRLLVDHGLASTDAMEASGSPKTRIRFGVTWADLHDALENPAAPLELKRFVASARSAIAR